MSRDSFGNYYLPAGNPVVAGTTIATAWANPTLADVGTALTDSLSRSGKGGMSAALAMGGFRITALAAAMAATDAAQAAQVRDFAYSWLTGAASDSTGNNYTASALLPTNPTTGTSYLLLADKSNTGAMTLSVNGSAALPILINGSSTPAGLIITGAVIMVTYVAMTYRITNTASVAGTINTVSSATPDALTVTNDYGTAIATITARTNVPNGLAQLGSDTKVQISQLPFTDITYVGPWSAALGANPSQTGRNKGDFYIISVTGTLTIYVGNSSNVYTSQSKAVAVGDAIILMKASGSGDYPDGWYFMPSAAVPAVASTTTMTPTTTLPAVTNVQSWMTQMDPIIAAKLPLAGGTMTGPILQPLAPATGNALANKTYVDGAIAALPPMVNTFNTRYGDVVLLSADVVTALGAAPALVTGATFTGPVVASSITVSGDATSHSFVQTPYIATLGATPTIDFANGQSQELTLSANAVIAAINNVPVGTILRLTLLVTTYTITWPAAVKWPLGVAPTLSSGPLKEAIVTMEKLTNGHLLATASVF